MGGSGSIGVPDSGYFEHAPLLLKRYLVTRLPPDVAVVTQVPTPKPPRLIVIRTATTRNDMKIAHSTRRCIINCWDRNELLAIRMAEKVRGYLIDASREGGHGIRRVTVAGEAVYFPDPDDPSNSPRAQLTVDITLRATFDP